MSDQVINAYAVYEINVDNDTYSEVDLSSINDEELKRFVLKIAYETSINPSSRFARFEGNSLARNVVDELASEDGLTDVEELAQHLLDVEKDYNSRIAHLNTKISSGSLVIAKVTRSDDVFIIISKIEFSNYLDKDSFLRKTGLPIEKSLLRSCFIRVNGDSFEENIQLASSNGVIPAFWQKSFLRAQYCRDNTENTNEAYKLIEHALVTTIKNQSKNDFIDMRDCLIGYFKSNTDFDISALKRTLTEQYSPVLEDLNFQPFINKVDSFVNKKKFDGTFEIDRKAVRKRARKKYPLDGDIQLVANSGTSNIYRLEKNAGTTEAKEFVVIQSTNVPHDFRKIDELP